MFIANLFVVLFLIFIALVIVTKVYDSHLGSKEESLRKKQWEETSYSRSQNALENIRIKRRQLLEKYGDETTISKLSAKEHYEEIKKFHKEAEQAVRNIERLSDSVMYLRIDNNLSDSNPSILFLDLVKRYDTRVCKDKIKKTIDYINRLLVDCQDHEKQKVLEQYRQELYALKDICRKTFQYCRSFVGEDNNDDAEDCMAVEYRTINGIEELFINRITIMNRHVDLETAYSFQIERDNLWIRLISTNNDTDIEMKKVINYLQKP